MKKILLLAALTLFSFNDAEAQRRNNNGNRTRVNRSQPVRVQPQRVRPQRRVIHSRRVRVIRGYYNPVYYNPIVSPWRGGVYRPYWGINTVPQQPKTPEQIAAEREALENFYEDQRQKKLAKYLSRPSKRNKKRLAKYNLLTGREADDITP